MSKTQEDKFGNRWLACDKCDEWVLYKNTHLGAKFEKIKRKKTAYTCRGCMAEEKVAALEEWVKRLELRTTEEKTKVDRIENCTTTLRDAEQGHQKRC